MKNTRALAISSIASAGILLVGCQAGSTPEESPSPESSSAAGSATAASTSTTPTREASGSPSSTHSTKSKRGKEKNPYENWVAQPGDVVTVPPRQRSGTYADGSHKATATHKFGDVTVTATIKGGKIVDVSATEVSEDELTPMIDAQAFPLLQDQVLAAQSEDIDGVSMATLTSNAYSECMQKILDEAA